MRYWGNWVLERAREELAPYYPTVNGQPTVAYLWARTVPCPDPACGAEVPLLKTLWLSQKEKMLPDTPRIEHAGFLRVKKTEHEPVVINGAALRLVPNVEAHRGFRVWDPPKDDGARGHHGRRQVALPGVRRES